MRPSLLQITVWEVKRALKGHETGRPCTIRGPGNELEKCVLRETDPYDRTYNFVCFTVNYQRTSLQCKKRFYKAVVKDKAVVKI